VLPALVVVCVLVARHPRTHGASYGAAAVR